MDLFLQFLTTMAIMYAFMRVGHSLSSIPQEDLESVDESKFVILGYITREHDVFYVWNYATDEFLGQGRTKHELESHLRSNLDELYQQLNIVDKDNGITLQAYRELDQ